MESKKQDLRPRISIKELGSNKTAKLPSGRGDARYLLPVGAIIMVTEGDEVKAGDVLARIPRETTKTKDITGGLPRVAELFEVRKPKETAVITEIDGHVEYGKQTKGKRKVVVRPSIGEPREYLIPKGKHVTVHEGDFVKAGEPLMDGSINPHDLLRSREVKDLARYLTDEVQEVYRLQGVKINDKHIEVIVRQMLRKVRVTDHGDTRFLLGEQVERWRFDDENDRIMMEDLRPGHGGAAAFGHHQGQPVNRFLHLGGFLPGDHQGAYRGGLGRQDRRAGRTEGKRDHGPTDTGRHRSQPISGCAYSHGADQRT